MALQATGIADLVTTTLNELGRGKFTDNISDYQSTVAMKRLLTKNKTTLSSGPEIEFQLLTDHNNSARWVGMYATDVVNVTNAMIKGKIGWRHLTWNWPFEAREPVLNSGASKIVDLIKTRRTQAMASSILKFENAFWRVPAASDDTTMYGLPYYIVKSNTANTTNDGINGTVPSGYTTVANINPTTYPRWANYATQYTAVTKDDLIRKWRHMAHYTDWKPLVDDIPQHDKGRERAYYTNYSVLRTLEDILETQNENLGNDIAPKDGSAVFKRSKIEAIKELDLDTTNPIYQVDWGVLYCVGLKGFWMKETKVEPVPGQHLVVAVHTDCTLNLICTDRRKLGVLATNTTMSY